MKRVGIIYFAAILLSACGSSPAVDTAAIPASVQSGALVLRDSVTYSQKDPNWASDRLGQTSDTPWRPRLSHARPAPDQRKAAHLSGWGKGLSGVKVYWVGGRI